MSSSLPEKAKAIVIELVEARAAVALLESELIATLGLPKGAPLPVSQPIPVPVAAPVKPRLIARTLPASKPKRKYSPRKKLTPALIAKVQQLRKAGKTVREIGGKLQLSKSTIDRALYTGATPPPAAKRKRLTPDIVAQVLEYRRAGKTVSWICEKMKLSKSGVGRALAGKTKAAREVKDSLAAITPPGQTPTETAPV